MSYITIQPPSADTFLWLGVPTGNRGTESFIEIFPRSTGIEKSLLSFDFHASIPAGSTINAATLSLYDYAPTSGRTITVYRLLRADWVEAQATWNIYKTGSNWGTAGASGSGVDFTPTDAATAASPSFATWMSWSVKNQIQIALDSVAGIAHFLVADLGSDVVAPQDFYSKEATSGNAALRPKLYIEYTLAPGPTVSATIITITTAQTRERLTVTLACSGSVGLPVAYVIVDGKAYSGLLTPDTLYTFTYDIALSRGPHVIYGQATDSVGTIATDPITIIMAYELAVPEPEESKHGIYLYSGDAMLDVFGVTLHDELLPALPTLNFSCAVLLAGTIGVVIRERNFRQYQFTIATVGLSGGIYSYTCKAAESYALTTAIMALQTAYGAPSDAISLVAPSLNIIDSNGLLALPHMTYPQLYQNVTPTEVIKQLLIQSLAQASVRNGNLYVFPLDVSAQIPDYHMQRLDPLTTWQRDADIYDAVTAHYLVKQYPTPDTTLTLNDAANWTGTVTDVTQVATTLLPVPSGALGMLKSVGSASRAGLNAPFRDFDRIKFNWNPVTATSVTVSLQQDASNKLELTHTFAGQQGSGFVQQGSPGVSTDTVTENIALSPVQFVTTVTGTVTSSCSYRVTLLNAAGATIWQDVWRSTIGDTFVATVPNDGPTSIAQTYQVTTVKIEFTNLYLIGANYGVQCINCYITVQNYGLVGSHAQVDATTGYQLSYAWLQQGDTFTYYSQIVLPSPPTGKWYTYVFDPVLYAYYLDGVYTEQRFAPHIASWDPDPLMGGNLHPTFEGFYLTTNEPWSSDMGPFIGTVTVILNESVADYAWVSSPFTWSPVFSLFEAVDIAFADMARTGNPMNLQTIALTFTGNNYVDTLTLVADNPLPVTVRAGTGSRAYVVTDDFSSQAGAQAYANGLLPIVSVPREQYTRDVSLATDLSVGDTVNCDGVNMTVYAIDYRPEGKTVAAGKHMDTLMERLKEQSRRLDGLERKV